MMLMKKLIFCFVLITWTFAAPNPDSNVNVAINFNGGSATGPKCGIPPPGTGCCGRPVLVRQVSEVTQKLLDTFKSQVEKKLNAVKPFPEFIVDCYLSQTTTTNPFYTYQVNTNGNNCILVELVGNREDPPVPLVLGEVRVNQPCE